MNIEDITQQIARRGQPDAGAFDAALVLYDGSRHDFSDSFAKETAQRYLEGVLDFDSANCIINCLSVWFPLENFPPFTWAIYRAFDEGEYLHAGQIAGTNEELYTRPMLRKAMSSFIGEAS